MSGDGRLLGIDFAHPSRLWLLLALLPLAAWVVRGGRRRARDWSALGQSGQPGGDGSGGWLAAVGVLILALAQPRWGRLPGAELPPGHDVVLCVDVSRSMGAEDAVPDRLGIAIESALGMLRALDEEPGHRSAVVAFAGRAVVRCPLTSNLDAVFDALRALRAGQVQPGGTDLGAALGAAADAFDDEEHAEGRTILLLSDGEDHPGSWPRALGRLRESGIVVHAVAVGDPDRAHPVPNKGGPASTKPRPGPAPETRRSDEALGAIAKATGGALVPIGLTPVDLGILYRDRIAATARRRRDEVRPPERVERFPAFVLAALAVGLAGSWRRRARPRWRRLPVAVASMAAIALGAGPGGDSPGALVEGGRAAFDAGRFAEALDAFERAIALEPAAAIPRYDSAATLFQLGRHREAIARYEEARKLGDRGLATKIDYALGNAFLALGEVPEALIRYDSCIASDWPGAAFDAVRRDAAENRAFAASQAPPPPDEPGGGAPKTGRPDRPRPPRGRGPSPPGDPNPSPDGPDPSDPDQGEPSSPSPARGDGEEVDRDRPPGKTPEARLDSALRQVRQARGPRSDEGDSGDESGRPLKDW